MTSREKAWLFAGILLGIVVTYLAGVANRPGHAERTAQGAADPLIHASLPQTSTVPEVQLTTAEQERIGLQTTATTRAAVSTEIVALGRVEELDTANETVNAPSSGRVERMLVDVGESITKGQAVAIIDNPDRPHVTIHSDSTGIVRSRNATEGRFVSDHEPLLVLVDLSVVRVRADVFASDMQHVRPGLKAYISSDALPGMTLEGEVKFLDSQSDPQAGTTPVRINVRNLQMRLRAGMLVRCAIQVPARADVLTVPRSAVIDTGNDKIVYLVKDGGIFERRSIQADAPNAGVYPVLAGLSEGDIVVTNGAFLIDSQTRLSADTAESSKAFVDNAPRSAKSSAYRIVFRTTPGTLVSGRDNSAHVAVLDASGRPVTDVQVRVAASMPAMASMGMPAMHQTVDLGLRGTEFVGSLSISMPGSWTLTVEARRAERLLATYQTHSIAR